MALPACVHATVPCLQCAHTVTECACSLMTLCTFCRLLMRGHCLQA